MGNISKLGRWDPKLQVAEVEPTFLPELEADRASTLNF